MARRVKAWEYDNSGSGAEHGVEFGVIPGVWQPGVAVLASAFGMSDEQLADAIEEFNLPIREVEVTPAKAVKTLPAVGNRMLTDTLGLVRPSKPDDSVRITDAGPIPAPPRAGNHPPLQPLAAAMQARTTVLSQGGTFEEATLASASAAKAAAAEYSSVVGDDQEAQDELGQVEADAEQQAATDGPERPAGPQGEEA